MGSRVVQSVTTVQSILYKELNLVGHFEYALQDIISKPSNVKYVLAKQIGRHFYKMVGKCQMSDCYNMPCCSIYTEQNTLYMHLLGVEEVVGGVKRAIIFSGTM